MSAQKEKLRQVIRKLVNEQINTDRRFVTDLDKLDKAVKTLDKDYRALINNSFSRIVLDDGNSGNTFDVQIYPVQDISDVGTERYDVRAYCHDSDRLYRKNQSIDDIVDYIKGGLKDELEEDSSYKKKALKKGKRPTWDDDEYEYVPAEELDEFEKIHSQDEETPSDEMEEVKKIKRQEDFKPADLKDVAWEEMMPGIDLDELADKIEGAVWGAIKREGAKAHEKTAKAEHDVGDEATGGKAKHVVSKAKRHSKKTAKVNEKAKDHEHSDNIKSDDSKIGTGTVKDFKDDKRKAKKDGKDEEYKNVKKSK